MSQNIVNISAGFEILPYPIRQSETLTGSWYGSQMGNGYALINCTTSDGNAIEALVTGYGRDNMIVSQPYYNNPDKLGGQTVPVLPYLSPASDDSWKPRYQYFSDYQVTTQVPTQSLPMMTHVYFYEAGNTGIFRISYVIDDDNFVVYDPAGLITGLNFPSPPLGACINTFATMNINIQGPSGTTVTIYNTLSAGVSFTGPFNMDFGSNQNGVVEPFIADVAAGTVIATIKY